jgi:hypothetical protein
MLEGDVKQMSILKKAMLGLVSITATVLVTKAVEQKLELTFFSSAMSVFWAWVEGLGNWIIRDITIPFWVVALVVLIAVVQLVVIVVTYNRWANAQLEAEGESSTITQLTKEQLHVFTTIGESIERGNYIGFEELLSLVPLSRITTYNALDVLLNSDLIMEGNGRWGRYIDFTREGRERFLELKSPTVAGT